MANVRSLTRAVPWGAPCRASGTAPAAPAVYAGGGFSILFEWALCPRNLMKSRMLEIGQADWRKSRRQLEAAARDALNALGVPTL